MEQLQSHTWLTATSHMVKYLRISPYIRKPFLIYDFATAPFWISLYMMKIFFSFLLVHLCSFYLKGWLVYVDSFLMIYCTLPHNQLYRSFPPPHSSFHQLTHTQNHILIVSPMAPMASLDQTLPLQSLSFKFLSLLFSPSLIPPPRLIVS